MKKIESIKEFGGWLNRYEASVHQLQLHHDVFRLSAAAGSNRKKSPR